MLYPSMCQSDKERYKQLLSLIGSLSNMFSDSNIPYLYYRVAERIYCNSFKALGFDKEKREYVWMVTSIIKDDRLKKVVYAK